MAVMMYRYSKLKGLVNETEENSSVQSAIAWVQENKIVSLTETLETANRAETAVILKNLYEVISK